jgi:hypothetical protein
MPQARNHMPVFIMGGLLLIYGLIVQTGALLPTMKYLSVHKSMDLQALLSFIIGGLALFGATINSMKKKTGRLDFRSLFSSTTRWRCHDPHNGHGYSMVS